MSHQYFLRLPDGSAPDFTCTNESLEAIMAGLEPRRGDTILAVGGSGDQAFAIIESGAHVVAVDFWQYQVAFIEWRREALARGDYLTFVRRLPISTDSRPLAGPRLVDRDEYFKNSERLEQMRANVKNLTIPPAADIFNILKGGVTCTKLYLSNIFGFGVVVPRTHFPLIRDALPHGGLAYITDQPAICDRHPTAVSTEPYLELCDHFLSFGMRIDAQRSLRARKLEHDSRGEKAWYPAVYEKIA